MAKEEFREIRKFPGYQVSNLGRVFSVPREITDSKGRKRIFGGKFLAQSINKSTGYTQVYVSINGKKHALAVHRAVWVAFNGEYAPGLEVDHKDFNRRNPSLENLQLVTQEQNNLRSAAAGRKRKTTQHLSDLDIEIIRQSARSVRMLGRIFKVGYMTIQNIRSRKTHFYIVGAV